MYSKYVEVQPERAIRNNFSGKFKLKWNLGSNVGFVPSKSFMKLNLTFQRGDETAFSVSDGVAPNYLVCDNLFQQVYQDINNVCVGKIDAYVPQISAIRHRTMINQSLKESLLSTTNYTDIYLEDRINSIADDGFSAKKSALRIDAEVLGLDLVQPHQFAVSAAGVLTITQNGGALIPDLTQLVFVGDRIRYVGNGTAIVVAEVIAVAAATITLLHSTPTVAVVAAKNITATNLSVLRGSRASRRQRQVELIWRPPLAFWDIDKPICGNGNFCLDLTSYPLREMQKYAIESLKNKVSGDGGDNVQVLVNEALLYLYTVNNYASDGKSYVLDDVCCSSQNITTTALNSKEFNISSKNYKITLAFQASNAGDDTRLSRSKFKMSGNAEQNITRYYITKDGVTLPDPIPNLNENEILNITQKYYENHGYNNTLKMEKTESLQEFLDAGLYFTHEFQNGPVKTSHVQVYTQFSELPANNLGQILLFDHCKKVLNLQVSNGKITGVMIS